MKDEIKNVDIKHQNERQNINIENNYNICNHMAVILKIQG